MAPANASAWMPDPVEFSQAAAGVHAAGGPVTTIATKKRFDLVALEWNGARTANVKLRVRSARRWSHWANASADDDGPQRGSHTFSAPIWAGGGDAVQVRSSRPLPGLELRLINTTGSATAADRARTRTLVARRGEFGRPKVPVTAAGMPRIVPRASWGASRCTPRTGPAYGSVRVAYVHHTESVNGYSRSRAASLVLGICLFHRNTRGWNDIGYDFLIDRYGDVFEGRAGGIDAPVIGAQAGGFNSESTGVSMIGSFTRVAPPKKAMTALARLLAWKLALSGVPAIGRTTVTSAGGSSTAYPAGTPVTVNNISGHRDVDQTSCPGNALYARLPSLRTSVARLQRGRISGLTIDAAPSQVAFGSGATVSGVLTVPAGASPDGAQVELRALGAAGPQTLTTATAGPDGRFTAQLPPLGATTALQAAFAGDATRPGVVSGATYVAVTPQLTLNATTQGNTVTATGTVAPAKRRVTVIAYLQRPAGTERRVASRTVGGASGSYRAGLALGDPGTYRIVAQVAADGSSTAGSSPSATVQLAPG